ncbi:hypothetical protein BDV12DRAFT_61561 [Aspergillus spectabilis]
MDGLLQIIRNTTLSLPDFLQLITHFIIRHKNQLPRGTRDLLSRTFRQTCLSSQDTHRISRARKTILQIRESDVTPSAELFKLIDELKASPFEFWFVKQMGSNWHDTHLLRHLYLRNRQNDQMGLIYRAFATTATFLLVEEMCKEYKVTNFTPRVQKHCSRLIMDKSNITDNHTREQVERNLKEDFRVGKLWYKYAAHLGGYGALFLVGVAPASLYENELKSRADLEFVASHFKSIHIPELATKNDLHQLGLRIIRSVLPEAERPVLPEAESNEPTERLARKRKCSNFTASGSAPPQTDDAPSSSSSRIPSDRVSASPRQESPPRTNSRHNGGSVLFEENGIQQQLMLPDSSLEASSNRPMLRSDFNSRDMPYVHLNRGSLDSGIGSSSDQSDQSNTTQEVPEQQPDTFTAERNDNIRTHQDRGPCFNEFTVGPALNRPLSLQDQSITNNTELGDYFLPTVFQNYVPNPLPPYIATPALSQTVAYDDCLPNPLPPSHQASIYPNPLPPSTTTPAPAAWDYLPNPLPPSTTTPAPAAWDYLPNPLPPSTTTPAPAAWDYLPNPLPPYTATPALSQIVTYDDCLPNPLPPSHQERTFSLFPNHPLLSTPALVAWDLNQADTISQASDYLPNPLPPSTATSASTEWDSYQSGPINTTGQSTSSSSICLPNPCFFSQSLSDRLTGSGSPYYRNCMQVPLASF